MSLTEFYYYDNGQISELWKYLSKDGFGVSDGSSNLAKIKS